MKELDQLEEKLSIQSDKNMKFLQPQIYKQRREPINLKDLQHDKKKSIIDIKAHSIKTFGSGGLNEMGSRMQRNIHFEVMQKKIESEISKTQLRKKTKGIIDNQVNGEVIFEKKTRRWL